MLQKELKIHIYSGFSKFLSQSLLFTRKFNRNVFPLLAIVNHEQKKVRTFFLQLISDHGGFFFSVRFYGFERWIKDNQILLRE